MTGAAPAAGAGPVVVAHVSDLHFGAEVPAAVESLVEDVAVAGPALVVVTGDLTMRARRPEFAGASALLARLPAPLLVVPGNHDVPLGLPGRLWTPYARFRAGVQDALDPCRDAPQLRALGLNSMPRWRWKGGRVSRRQAGLVTGVLATAPPGAVRLLALHHPVSPRGPAGIAGRDRLLRAAGAARVDLILAGHTHRPAVRGLELRDGERVHRAVEVVAGTATSHRDRGAGRSWSLIRIHPDAIQVDVRGQDGSRWSRRRAVRYPRGSG